MSEQERIDLLMRRDGEGAARAWVERTLQLYRGAIASGGYAASKEFRPVFEQAIREFEEWLRVKSDEVAPTRSCSPRNS